MGGRVYTTTSVVVGGTKISVRQPVFRGAEHVPRQVGELVRVAREWLALGLMKLTPTGFIRDVRAGRGRTEFDPAAFRLFFLQDPDPAALNTVRAALSIIYTGVAGSFGIKVRSLSDARGSVKPYYPMFGDVSFRAAGFSRRRFGECSRVNGMLWYDKDDDLLHSKGEIHLDLDIINEGPDAVRTLIHEAGHKFANLWDMAYFNVQTQQFKKPITAADALRNADSYAHFVKRIASKTLERAQARAAAANDDALEGVGSLFS